MKYWQRATPERIDADMAEQWVVDHLDSLVESILADPPLKFSQEYAPFVAASNEDDIALYDTLNAAAIEYLGDHYLTLYADHLNREQEQLSDGAW